jgi:hypothetical protein
MYDMRRHTMLNLTGLAHLCAGGYAKNYTNFEEQ